MMKPFTRLLLAVSLSSIGGGCATLPKASEAIDGAPASSGHARIVSAKGLLSSERSRAIMERLERSVEPTDLLRRYEVVMESVSGSPLTKGNKVTLLVDGPATYAAMFEAIRNARVNVNLESYILEDDETGRRFADLLLQRQAQGIRVNLIYDSLGSSGTGAPFFQRLRDGGVQVVEFNQTNPLKAGGKWGLIHRDHRKILVVDGIVAITGGINISQVYSSSLSRRRKNEKAPVAWHDIDVQIEGPGVAEFQQLFLETWRKQNGPKLSEDDDLPAPKEEGNALVRALGSTPGQTNRLTFVAYVAAVTFAEHSIHLTNAYFIPDEQILKAFTDAAGRGVDVKLIVPSITDSSTALAAQRSNYSELLKSGVKIYERRKALLHAKTAVIDGVWSTVGSTNMDFWSFASNDEVNAVVLSRDFAEEVEKRFAEDILESDEIRLDAWKRRSVASRMKEWVAHLFLRWL
jgi:cardiolipin synthase A/B